MVKQLPEFKGYTIDIRLREFRKVIKKGIKFISFNSNKGEILLVEYIDTLNKESDEFKELKNIF